MYSPPPSVRVEVEVTDVGPKKQGLTQDEIDEVIDHVMTECDLDGALLASRSVERLHAQRGRLGIAPYQLWQGAAA